jgi:8-oxo-dGTP pyrophosphatase MutT (NUDIX family)
MSTLSFDPQQMPVAAVAGEPAVPAARLSPAGLRAHFAQPPAWMPEQADESALAALRDKALTPASVLIPLVARQDGLHVLLTQRTAHLTDHAGQISFPGGRAEPEDASPVDTALRETEEEIGLPRRHIELLGTLPDYVTGTGYRVTPVAALVHGPFTLAPDPFEVAEAFEVPLAFLMDGAHHERRVAFIGGTGQHRTFYAMPWRGYFIWGATAGMLRNLFHFLSA